MLTYRWQYYITHPWELINDICRQFKWAYQRVFKGWDDRVIFSIDWYLVDVLPVWLAEHKKYRMGIPSDMFDEPHKFEHSDDEFEIAIKRWDEIIDKMIVGFKSGRELQDWKTFEPPEEFNLAMDLFKEHFFSLWT